ncbi:lipocalin-like protein [uncultured phage cr115_1]|uniref:Lipocalin-like protein n=1 Tax=uncultured phage cr115_1 TaxID=2772089 RepID=A0A7M1S083_9CAUD|nr:lipocalin-like protein [uncultured phage cr115_1]QOR60018.1 lipocalin-like protein [uncultured phage cr115_1]
MSNEIATYSMILSKLSLGKSGTECPTKTLILAINSLIVIDNASTYGANECVKIDDIRKKAETWNYYLTVSPTSMSFGAGGGSKSFTVSSYKRKVLDGVELSGDTSVSLKSTTISGTGFSLSGTTVSASANEITSNRTGTVTITQNESNKTVTISLSQDGDDVSSYGEWTISVSASPTSVSSSGGTSTITASAKRTVYWVSGDVTEETGNPTLSTNLGSLSSSSSPSTLTLGENTSTSSRTATIKATHGGKSATCTVTQAGATPSTTYTFSINPYKVNVGSSGGSGSVTISSYKTVGSSTYDVDYSIDSSTLPSWASFNKSTSTFTIQSTTSTTGRTAKVYFDLDESGKRDYAELTQTGYTPPADNYVFTWDDGSTSDVSASFPWDFSANGTAANIPVISTKNGSSQSWSVSSKPSWITTSTTSSKVTISASDNSGSARSGKVVLTQSGSGKTLTINVSQEAKAADEYYLGVRKSGETSSYESITFNNVPAKTTNWSGDYTYVSRKNGVFFDNVSFSANVSWITVDSNGGYTVAHNTSGLPRQGTITLTQAESGLKCYINIYQIEYNATHGMRISPSSIRVSSSALNVNFSVDSYKTVLHSDGSETEESVDYTFSTDSKWFTYYGNTTNTTGIVITSNITTSLRSATFTLTQVGGKSKGIVTVTQAAGLGGVTDTFTVTPSSLTVSGNSATAVVNSSSPWTARIGQGTNYSTVSPTSGSAGQTTITISDTTSSYLEVLATITRTSPSYKEITATVIFVR